LGRIGFLAAALVVVLQVGYAAAAAGATSDYRDPPSYEGITKPPKSDVTELTSSGSEPDVLVDEAGTAHVVWAEGRGDDADVARYCRIKRADDACDKSVTLTWNKPYGVGDDPRYNVDNDGPRIVRLGDQLLVLSRRYPTVAETPEGFRGSNVIGWVSNDGGGTWSTAKILGVRSLGQLAVIGPEDDPTVVNLNYDALCGGMCINTYKSGVYSSAEGILNTDPSANYNASLVRDGSSLIAGFSSAGSSMWLRRWSGTGSVMDPSRWSATEALTGTEPELAGGPGGAYLMARDRLNGLYQVSRLTTGAGNVVQPGTPTPITDPDASVSSGRIIEDGSGRLTAAWQEGGTGLQLRTSTTGPGGFSAPQTLVGEEDARGNSQIELDAYRDGGGFAVVNRSGWAVGEGKLQAVGFGTKAPTKQPGLGDLEGGGNITCEQIGFGAFEVETVQGCFLKGTGRNSKTVVTGGAVKLNGLVIKPDPGSQLVIDAKALTIDTIGEASVIAENDAASITLFHGAIHRNLSGLKPGDRLFEFPVGEYVADVLGFDVAGDMPVRMTPGGVRIPIDVTLPVEFGGFTGHAELIATEGDGLELDSLNIHIGPVPLGVLVVEKVDVEWRSGGNWRGEGKLTVPAGGSIDARVEFEQGDFKSAGFDYVLAPPQTIGPFVYLLSIGGDFGVDPIEIAARASFGAGAAVQGQAPVKLDGEFTMTFPKSGPASFRFDGDVEMFLMHVGDGFMEFQSDGYAKFGGGSHLSIGPLSGGVDVNGFVDARSGRFGADINGSAEICVAPDGVPFSCGSIGADAAVSNAGFAACARINPPDPFGGFSGGLRVPWDEINPAALVSPIVASAEIIDFIAIPCSTAGFRVPPPRRVPASGRRAGEEAFAIDGGLPTATILVEGADGVPDVTVTGPGGASVSPGGPSEDGYMVGIPGTDAKWVVLDEPNGGTWTVTPESGSPAIEKVQLSDGYEAASVKRAKVTKGTIDYELEDMGNGQKVVFRESGDFGVGTLGSTAKRRGTLKFKPTAGAGGKRRVEALITHEGLVTDRVPIGSYKAPPPPRPGGVKKLRGKLSGSTLKVTFKPSKVADSTFVRVDGKGGADLARMVSGKARKATFGGLRWQRKLRVTVQSSTAEGRSGPKRTLVVK